MKKKGRCEGDTVPKEGPQARRETYGPRSLHAGGLIRDASVFSIESRKCAKLGFSVLGQFFLEISCFFALPDKACCFLLPIFAAGCLLRA